MATTKLQQEEKAHFATANSYNLPISTKKSVEVASFVRGRKLSQAKMLLSKVLEKKVAVPFKRYNMDTPHRKGKGIAAGRFPQNVTKYFLVLMNTVEANAQDKGLDTNSLMIKEVKANQGTQQMRPSRHPRRLMKRTHLSIQVEEKQQK